MGVAPVSLVGHLFVGLRVRWEDWHDAEVDSILGSQAGYCDSLGFLSLKASTLLGGWILRGTQCLWSLARAALSNVDPLPLVGKRLAS